MKVFLEVAAEQRQYQPVQDIGHTAESSNLDHATRSAEFGERDRKPRRTVASQMALETALLRILHCRFGGPHIPRNLDSVQVSWLGYILYSSSISHTPMLPTFTRLSSETPRYRELPGTQAVRQVV